MKVVFASWLIGLLVSLLIGHLVTDIFLNRLRLHIKRKADQRHETEIFNSIMSEPLDAPNWLIGLTERTFFTILVSFNVPATAIAMITWIAVKMVYNWGVLVRENSTVTHRSLAFSALLGNISSMFFAALGGIICRIA